MSFRIVLLGPPGAGKGTHARILSERYKLVHVSTGDLLRTHIKKVTDLGKRAKSFVDSGKLVADDLVIEMIKAHFEQQDISEGFILDGFPRTVEQAYALERMLEAMKSPINMVLEFGTSEEVVVDRLAGRRNCSNCGANYHIRNIPPKKEGICDECGAKLVARPDDQPETVKHRLAVYKTDTKPLIDFYAERGTLRTIDGDLDVKSIQKELTRHFSKS
jgi:adenylate kinase